MIRPAAIAALVVTATPALADRVAADRCAGRLAPEAKLIYASVLPGIFTAPDPREHVISHTRSLVMAGKISIGAATTSAENAGACLRLLAK
jgi:hypothetical protein